MFGVPAPWPAPRPRRGEGVTGVAGPLDSALAAIERSLAMRWVMAFAVTSGGGEGRREWLVGKAREGEKNG